jgi:hypothetical protein
MTSRIRAVTMAVALIACVAGGPPARAQDSDLDTFMARVLERRDENWKKLRQYLLDEREEVAIVGPSGAPLWGERRDYTWFIRDGVFVRSPLRANGVIVAEADRRKYEDDFARRALERGKAGGGDSTAGGPADVPASAEALLTSARQPQFIDNAYFLKFQFERGRYALVGREAFEGRDVLRIEYYPERLFRHEQDQKARRDSAGERDRSEDLSASTERMMNKVSLVTLWVEPTAHQIVRYTFDNVEMDFLPAAWFLRVTDARASMTMGEPFPGVWLPREVDMAFGAMFAAGAIDMRYRIEYHGYREATTSGRIRLPGEP